MNPIRSFSLLLCWLVSACLHTAPEKDVHPYSIEDYFPLRVGLAWVYDVTIDKASAPALLQVLVTDRNREEYTVSQDDESVAPKDKIDHPATYEVRQGGGIYYVEAGAYFLRAPLRPGRTWTADESSKPDVYRILSIGETIKTSYHVFADCLVMERREAAYDRRIEFVLAPGVGVVRGRFYRLSGKENADPYREEVLVEFRQTDPPEFLRPLR